ncbi:hypothetical protein FHT44_003320 [Mycolicibacterium sp. BK634]|nr:hypothetical protein [Mycolicibacterium sp. BK634]TDO07227.1 hypothetical protein EV580_6194 [Mycobacterium sp. BK086]
MLLEDPYTVAAGGLTARTEPTYFAHTSAPLSRRFPRHPQKQSFHPNDAAQARLFSELMQAEIDDLEDLIMVAERRWSSRLDAGWGAERTPEPVLRLREKLKEVRRLQDSLQARFGTD